MKETQLSIIAALDQQHALETWNNIHEYFSTVEEHLKEITEDSIVIVNAMTYELIKDIDLFENLIVITDDVIEHDDKVRYVSSSYADALALAKEHMVAFSNDEIFILANEEVFRECLEEVNKIRVILINTTFDHELDKAPSLVKWSIDHDDGFITNDVEEDNIYGTTLFTLVRDEDAGYVQLLPDEDIKMTLWLMKEMHDSNLIIDYDRDEDTIRYQFKGIEIPAGDYLVNLPGDVVHVAADNIDSFIEKLESLEIASY